MVRYPAWAVFVVTAALGSGCGPGKELPSDGVNPQGAPVAPRLVPEKSDPAAKAVVDRAVTALTGGKSELLARGKVSRLTLKGSMYSIDNANQSADATRSIAAVWPDRLHFVNESESSGTKLLVESWLRRPEFVVARNGSEYRPPNPADAEQNLASEVVGQHWMVFLLPLTDPKAVVYDPLTIALDRRDLNQLKLALGEYPVYQLTFDAKTDALVRVEYTINDPGLTRRTTMIFSDHKPGPDGLFLPYRFECRHNNNVVEKWAVEKWELPAAIKDEEFSPKKK